MASGDRAVARLAGAAGMDVLMAKRKIKKDL
jgi:hypothetical protein